MTVYMFQLFCVFCRNAGIDIVKVRNIWQYQLRKYL